jgi:solute carrier family 45 protein 1/2/4
MMLSSNWVLQGGAILMLLANASIAYSREAAVFFLGSETKPNLPDLTIFFAVAGFYFLDFSINAVQASCRSLIVDAVPLNQQNEANIWASRMAAFGNVFGYFTGFVDLMKLFQGLATAYPVLFGSQLKILCFVSSVFLVLTLIMACIATQEKVYVAPEGTIGARQSWYGPLSDILGALRGLPTPLQAICNVQFFSWLGWFPFLFYA